MGRPPLDSHHIDLSFACDASPEHWMVQSASFAEHLDRPYRLELELACDHMAAEPVLLLGQPVSLTITRDAVHRAVRGIVSEVHEGTPHPELVTARVAVVPALEGMRHRVNTRVFQDASVPEILLELLGEGLGSYGRQVESRLSRDYPRCEIRVQYDESDFDFCRRLMEEEGIVYWFEHESEAELLVLADSNDEYAEVRSPHGAVLPYTTRTEGALDTKEHVYHLEVTSRLTPTRVVTRHFDWTRPSVAIEASSEASDPGAAYDCPCGAYLGPDREVYRHDEHPLTLHDYGGRSYGADDSVAQARLQREAQAWEARIARAETTVMGAAAGAVLEVSGHPRADLDGRYLVITATHRFGGRHARAYWNELLCIPADVVYRPARTRPKPRIDSVLTAVVVGPSGEEIHTDEHGRVRVQFHWDRVGAGDEHSFAWLRVMQPWAGAGWGFLVTPRIGMEVSVGFLNGDPDRPLVTGTLYNGAHPPPYHLPDDKTKSTIKTSSSLGGAGFNELRLEDAAGSEEVYVHAQKDWNEEIENDHTTTVHHDQRIRVDNDQVQEIGNDQTEHVFANQSLEVDGDRAVRVHGSFDEQIDGTETRTVTGDVTETFSASETRSVGGDMSETIEGDRSQDIGGSSSETIGGSLTQSIDGGATITTPASYDITALGGFTMTTPGPVNFITSGQHLVLAPSGQTRIDEEIDSAGGNISDNFVLKMLVTLAKTIAVTSAQGVATTYIETGGNKNWVIAGAEKWNAPVSGKVVGQKMANAVCRVINTAFRVET